MAAVTFGDAAAVLGHRSRSSLYRLRKAGFLADYLREGGKGGAQLLELEPDGVLPLREYCRGILRARVDSPLWRPEPSPEPKPEPEPEADSFWSKWGRCAGPDDPPLSDAEFWENVGLIVVGMTGQSFDLTPNEWGSLAMHLRDAQADVEAGARWDQARWDFANIELLLDDLPCDSALATLRELLEAGKVPPELLEQVREVLTA
jgi:hypothetical protein